MPSLLRAATLAALAALAAPLPAAAQDDSAAAGEEIARRWCASCHVVADRQLLASADAPSFAAIAAESTSGFDWLAAFLADPHPAMPRLSLTRQQLRDLSAYLASLRE